MTQENVCILKSSSQCLKRTESIKMICFCYLKPYEHLLHNRNMDQDIFGFGFFKTTMFSFWVGGSGPRTRPIWPCSENILNLRKRSLLPYIIEEKLNA